MAEVHSIREELAALTNFSPQMMQHGACFVACTYSGGKRFTAWFCCQGNSTCHMKSWTTHATFVRVVPDVMCLVLRVC